MQLGVHVANFTWPDGSGAIAPRLSAVAETAEEIGCSWVSVMDHYFQMDAMFPVDDPMLEGYTTLGYLAARTERVRLGLLVTGVTYRHPGLLAKIVSTLDVLSEGRAQLGIGAAWYEREHAGLGVPFPPVAERFERLEETLQICLQMWSDDNGPFEGRHYQLAETLDVPSPISEPHPPILIGGTGERKTLRLVAQYADACNLFGSAPDEVAHKLDVLRRHCDDVGRDPADITNTILYFGDALAAGEPDRFLEEMSGYASVGVEGVIVMPIADDPVAVVESLGADVMPRLRDL